VLCRSSASTLHVSKSLGSVVTDSLNSLRHTLEKTVNVEGVIEALHAHKVLNPHGLAHGAGWDGAAGFPTDPTAYDILQDCGRGVRYIHKETPLENYCTVQQTLGSACVLTVPSEMTRLPGAACSATVYLAVCKQNNQPVAIKALNLEALMTPMEDVYHEVTTMRSYKVGASLE